MILRQTKCQVEPAQGMSRSSSQEQLKKKVWMGFREEISRLYSKDVCLFVDPW